MRVLIGCEFSATVREAFARLGHDAWSCDILPSEIPGQHLQCDIFDALKMTWDAALLHPPCTAICVSGNRHYGEGKPKARERVQAVEWTWRLWDVACANVEKVSMENPIGVLSRRLKPSQIIQPWQFGHGETKATCLWLNNLPLLKPTKIVTGREQRIWKLPPTEDRWKLRSKTFQGISDAMAEQWGRI